MVPFTLFTFGVCFRICSERHRDEGMKGLGCLGRLAYPEQLRLALTTEKSLEPPHSGLSFGRGQGLVMMRFGFDQVMPWSSE